jgi:GTP cyclohydrolase I
VKPARPAPSIEEIGVLDIQSQPDARGISIDEVGITGLKQPFTWDDGSLTFSGMAEVEIVVALPAERRGTHMSRMVEAAAEHLHCFDPHDLPRILKSTATLLDADEVRLTLASSFGTQVTAPVTERTGWQAHALSASGSLAASHVATTITVASDVTSLCPCSKAISDYGAHNQRSLVRLSIHGDSDRPYPIDVLRLVELVRASGSCGVYPVIKRPDERWVTMKAYDTPMFVEDMARELSKRCREHDVRHKIEIRNIESIHSHDAIAVLAG